MENEKHKIYLPVNNTIEDSYDITHEIIHDMSLNGNISEARHIFCEVFSYFAEELQYEYLKTYTNARDCDINHSNILACVTERNCILKYMQQFVGTYLNQGIITENDLVNLYVQSEYEQLFQYTIKEILENGAILFDYNQRYVIGIIFAYYMLDRVHTNKNNIQEFFDLNEVINAYDVVDFLHYLDLELTDSDIFDLTEESYRKLENSFVKILKRR